MTTHQQFTKILLLVQVVVLSCLFNQFPMASSTKVLYVFFLLMASYLPLEAAADQQLYNVIPVPNVDRRCPRRNCRACCKCAQVRVDSGLMCVKCCPTIVPSPPQ
ncbi:hypothetical protein Ancab_040012 [Ancistrocladus abbreviatus]